MMSATSITVRVPLAMRRRGGRKVIIAPDGSAIALTPRRIATRADPAILKALARAFRWKRMPDDGRYASISELAQAEKIDRGYAGVILRLTLLAPDIFEALVDGRQSPDLGLPALMEPFPLEWDRQRANILGLRKPPD